VAAATVSDPFSPSPLLSQMAEKKLMHLASVDVLKDLLLTSVTVLLDPQLSGYPEGAQATQHVNLVLSNIMRLTDQTNIFW